MLFVRPLILITLTVIWSCQVQAIALCRDSALEKVERAEDVLNDIFGWGKYDAKELFQTGKFQEAAWVASQKYGDTAVRDQIEIWIAEDMAADTYVAASDVKQGATVAEVVVGLESGQVLIFKPNPEFWSAEKREAVDYLSNPKSEVAAYRASRILGWDIVPVTIEGKHSGREGTFQAFVHSDRSIMDPNSILKLEIFDYIIDNRDRVVSTYHNALAFKKRAIGYDHGLAFQPSTGKLFGKYRPRPLRSLRLDRSTADIYYDLKRKFTDENISRDLSEHMSEQSLLDVIVHRDLVLRDYEDAGVSLSSWSSRAR